ncbi:hypothetical protein P4S72_25300 [Vibrio sp. PP-XX7]
MAKFTVPLQTKPHRNLIEIAFFVHRSAGSPEQQAAQNPQILTDHQSRKRTAADPGPASSKRSQKPY